MPSKKAEKELKKMTRLELAKAIYRNNKKLGIVKVIAEKDWCKYLLHGCYPMKAQSKAELESWLKNTTEQLAERNLQ